jgi:hypothetical protein
VAHRSAHAAALLAVLGACGAPARDGSSIDAAIDAPIDAMRSVVCARAGTSSVTGTGPGGSLDTSHVYSHVVTGFCPDTLVLIVTVDDPLAWPYLAKSGVIRAQVPQGSIGGPSEWSGTFPATIELPDETAAASGTLQVDQATSGYVSPTRVRATASFDDGGWHFTATIDVPYCDVVNCI